MFAEPYSIRAGVDSGILHGRRPPTESLCLCEAGRAHTASSVGSVTCRRALLLRPHHRETDVGSMALSIAIDGPVRCRYYIADGLTCSRSPARLRWNALERFSSASLTAVERMSMKHQTVRQSAERWHRQHTPNSIRQLAGMESLRFEDPTGKGPPNR